MPERRYLNTIAPLLVSVIVLVGFITMAVLILTRSMPSGDAPMFIAGGLLAMTKDVVGYWLGSSASSERKDRAISELTQASFESVPARMVQPKQKD